MTKRIHIPKKKCSICKIEFQPIRSTSNKCSPKCRTEWYRISTEKRVKDQVERNKKKHTIKKCRTCSKDFMGAKSRVNCSPECSIRYIQEGVGFRHYYLKNLKKKPEPIIPSSTERDVGYDLKILKNDERYSERLSIHLAMEKYRDEGGKITVLAAEPNQPLPSVNYEGGWDWYATLGVGTYTGAGDYSETPEIIETIL